MTEDYKMKNGKCPKCGSDSVFTDIGTGGRQGDIGISLFSTALADNYICTSCGYVENYISQKDKLKEIREKWRRIGS